MAGALADSPFDLFSQEEEENEYTLQRRKRKERDAEDEEIFCLVGMGHSFVLTACIIASRISGPSAHFHHDKARWESAKNFQWLHSEGITSSHFSSLFRFTPEQLQRLCACLSLPEFVPGVRLKIPGIIGLCMLLMRYEKT